MGAVLPSLTCPAPQTFRLVSSEQALKELGLAEHQLRFTCRVHLHDPRKEQEMAMRVYSHLKRWALRPPLLDWGEGEGGQAGSHPPPCSLLKDHCVQHLPDGSVTVESILIQAAAHSEDPGTKVLLVSWTYQVSGHAGGHPMPLGCVEGWVREGRMGQQPLLASGYRTKSWEATSHLCSRRACPRPPEALLPAGAPWLQLQDCVCASGLHCVLHGQPRPSPVGSPGTRHLPGWLL